MSILLAQSQAVREPFIHLLEKYQGIYGLIDREMDAMLFWLRDKAMEVNLPDAWMGLAEIENTLDQCE